MGVHVWEHICTYSRAARLALSIIKSWQIIPVSRRRRPRCSLYCRPTTALFISSSLHPFHQHQQLPRSLIFHLIFSLCPPLGPAVSTDRRITCETPRLLVSNKSSAAGQPYKRTWREEAVWAVSSVGWKRKWRWVQNIDWQKNEKIHTVWRQRRVKKRRNLTGDQRRQRSEEKKKKVGSDALDFIGLKLGPILA